MSDQTTRHPLLLVRPLPFEGEASPEYLQRICHVNGLAGVRDIMDLLTQTFGELMQIPPFTLHSILSGLESASQLPKATTIRGNGTQYNRMGISNYARTCPYCLRESNTLNGEWCLPLSISCKTHQRLLIDRCPECSKPIRRTESQYWCTCGCKFHLVETKSSPEWVEQFYTVFAPWRSERNYCPTDGKMVAHEMSAVKFLRRIAPIAAEVDRAACAYIHAERAQWLCSRDVGPLESLMTAWPGSVVEAITKVFLENAHRTVTWESVSNNASENLRQCLSNARAVANAQCAAISLATRTSRLQDTASFENISKALGIDPETAKLLRQDETWKAAMFKAADCPPNGSLIVAIRIVAETSWAFCEAAKYLKVSHRFLLLLMSQGYLAHVRCGHHLRNVRILQRGLDNFLKHLQTCSSGSTYESIDHVCLVDLPMAKDIELKGKPQKRITRFLADLIAGNVPLICLTETPTTLADFALPALYVAEKLRKRPEFLPLFAIKPSATALA